MRAILALVLVAAACSSSSSSPSGPTDEPVNPCATKGSTYVVTFTQQPGGTCGALTSVVENVNADGTVTTSTPITCAHVSQNGCTVQDTDCTWTSMGVSFSETAETTFAADGSSATGVATLTAKGNGVDCVSTYDTSSVRQ